MDLHVVVHIVIQNQQNISLINLFTMSVIKQECVPAPILTKNIFTFNMQERENLHKLYVSSNANAFLVTLGSKHPLVPCCRLW